ncbi:MAG: regulatory protein GemA [Gallionella sp.]|nr:regulatory protein GemA [Gallionella sp.]
MPSARRSTLPAACIKQVQIARKRLDMSDADYRALLQRVAGVTSSTELTQAGFALVMDEFARLGFISTARHEAAMQDSRAPWAASYAQRSKIAAMWDAWKGQHDPQGLRHWLEHHHGVSDLRFCSSEKASKIIGALMHFNPKSQTDKNAI